MIPRSGLAQAIGQSVLRCVEKYEKETGKRASKIVIQLTDTDDWQRKDLPTKPDDTGTVSIAKIEQHHFGFTLKVESEPEPL